jgi:competence protein ComEC
MQKDPSGLPGPLLIFMACSLSGGIVLASLLTLSATVYFLAMLIVLPLLVFCWPHPKKRMFLLLALGFMCGAWRYAQVSPNNDPYNIARWIGPTMVDIQGTVSDEPTRGPRTRTLHIEVSQARKHGATSWSEAHGTIEIQTMGLTIEDPYGANYGDSIQASGKLQPPLPHSAVTIVASMTFPGIHVLQPANNTPFAWLFHLRIVLANIIEQALPQPDAALLIAILLSLHTPALKPLTTAFNVTSTAHLIAPSGFKITILAGIIANLAGRFLPTAPQTMQLPAFRRGSWRTYCVTAIVTFSIFLYTTLSGMGPAAIRAGIMGTLLVIAPRLGRKYNIYTALAFTELLMGIHDPRVLWDAGFQLSFCGTLGIVLYTPHFQRLFHRMHLDRIIFGEMLTEICAVTLAAQVATLPIIAINFQQVSFVALPANILTVPLLGPLISGGFLLCILGLIAPLAAQVVAWTIHPLLWYTDKIVAFWASLPGSYLPVTHVETGLSIAYYGFLLLLHFALKQKERPVTQQVTITTKKLTPRTWRILQLCGVAIILAGTSIGIVISQFNNPPFTLTFLTVKSTGQTVENTTKSTDKVVEGEAILVQTSDGKSMLIDGRDDTGSLAQELDGHFPSWQRSLNVVLLTTPRPDHLNGLLDVIQRYRVGTVIEAGMLHPNTTYALWRRTINEKQINSVAMQQGTQFTLGKDVTVQILWPESALHKGSNELRDNALVVRIVTPFLHVLLLGVAAESQYALQGLLSSLDESNLRAEVVQVEGEESAPFAPSLQALLKKTQGMLFIETPAATSARQTKQRPPLPIPVAGSQLIQTKEAGTLAITGDAQGITFFSP